MCEKLDFWKTLLILNLVPTTRFKKFGTVAWLPVLHHLFLTHHSGLFHDILYYTWWNPHPYFWKCLLLKVKHGTDLLPINLISFTTFQRVFFFYFLVACFLITSRSKYKIIIINSSVSTSKIGICGSDDAAWSFSLSRKMWQNCSTN